MEQKDTLPLQAREKLHLDKLQSQFFNDYFYSIHQEQIVEFMNKRKGMFVVNNLLQCPVCVIMCVMLHVVRDV